MIESLFDRSHQRQDGNEQRDQSDGAERSCLHLVDKANQMLGDLYALFTKRREGFGRAGSMRLCTPNALSSEKTTAKSGARESSVLNAKAIAWSFTRF